MYCKSYPKFFWSPSKWATILWNFQFCCCSSFFFLLMQTIVPLKIWCSNFFNNELFLPKAEKLFLKICFRNYVCHVFDFRQMLQFLSCTCWWWLPSGLVSQPFRKHVVSNFTKTIINKIFFDFSPKFHFGNSKCKIYFVKFLENYGSSKTIEHMHMFYLSNKWFTTIILQIFTLLILHILFSL